MPHVTRPDQAVPFQLWDPARRGDPYPFYAGLRRERPVVRAKVPGRGVVWVVSRYDDVVRVLRDPEFSNDRRGSGVPSPFFGGMWMPKAIRTLGNTMAFTDDPAHARLRGLVGRAFTPRRIEALEDHVQAVASRLLDGAAARGSMDLVAEFAVPLPLTVISELLGVPEDWRPLFRRRSQGIISPPAGLARRLAVWLPRMTRLVGFFEDLIAFRRRNPDDGLITALIAAEGGEDRLSHDELVAMIFLLLFAGFETTTNLLGSGVLALQDHPEQLALLRAEPGLMKGAVEELLRFTNPVEAVAMRYTRHEVRIAGTALPPRATVLALLSSANRDEGVFHDADLLNVTRTDNRHLAFGVGGHYCLGASLARLEGRIALSALLDRCPGLRLAVPRAALEWRDPGALRGLKALPICWA